MKGAAKPLIVGGLFAVAIAILVAGILLNPSDLKPSTGHGERRPGSPIRDDAESRQPG